MTDIHKTKLASTPTYLTARVSNFFCFFTIPSLFLQCTYYICFSAHIDQRNLIPFYSLLNFFSNSIIHIITTVEISLMLVTNIFSATLNVHD